MAKNNKSHKVQPSVDQYTHHVLKKLVGIKGTSVSDVAGFILRDWIGDHIEELEKYKITVERKNGKLTL